MCVCVYAYKEILHLCEGLCGRVSEVSKSHQRKQHRGSTAES